MSEYKLDNSHVSEGLALLTGDNAQTNIKALLTAWLQPIQDLETVIYAVYQSRFINTAANAQLDLLGALVGEPRNNRTDAAYRVGIRIRVLVNFAIGSPFDIVQIAVTGAPDVVPYYCDMGGGHWQLTAVGLTASDDSNTLALAFNQAEALGTNGDFIFSASGTTSTLRADTLAGGFVPVGLDDLADALAIGKACSMTVV